LRKPQTAAAAVLPTPAIALRPRDAARELSISERLLWEWTRSEGLPHIRIGAVVLYPVDGLRQWLNERSISQAGGPEAAL
jgi:hypothetical protein